MSTWFMNNPLIKNPQFMNISRIGKIAKISVGFLKNCGFFNNGHWPIPGQVPISIFITQSLQVFLNEIFSPVSYGNLYECNIY